MTDRPEGARWKREMWGERGGRDWGWRKWKQRRRASQILAFGLKIRTGSTSEHIPTSLGGTLYPFFTAATLAYRGASLTSALTVIAVIVLTVDPACSGKNRFTVTTFHRHCYICDYHPVFTNFPQFWFTPCQQTFGNTIFYFFFTQSPLALALLVSFLAAISFVADKLTSA